MSREREWVERVKADVQSSLEGNGLTVETGCRLPYALQVAGYRTQSDESGRRPVITQHGYETDLLIAEQQDADWVPRVVVEFKLGGVSTHDALTYSAKAATHKQVHPHLRYGIVVGGYDGPVPQRVLRHGAHFDFMLTLASEVLTSFDRERLIQLLEQEVEASRTIGKLVLRDHGIRLIHRKLEVRP